MWPVFYFLQLNDPQFTRYSLQSYSFLFVNPGAFVNSLIVAFCFAFITAKKFRPILVFLTLFLLASSLRTKGFVCGFALVGLYFFLSGGSNFRNPNRPLLLSRFIKSSPLLLPLLAVAIFVGIKQVELYFFTDLTPRLLLLVEGWKIFWEYFPFGSGAGTYGSAVASMFYSPIYETLGFRELYGLSAEPGTRSFLNDQFWSIILAQYGFFGFLFVVYFFRSINRDVRASTGNSKEVLFLHYFFIFYYSHKYYWFSYFNWILGYSLRFCPRIY